MGMMGGRGVLGTVTEVAADHYIIKTETGELYTIHFSANTRIMKQPAQRQNQGGGERTPPQALKATDIKVGDAVAANGDVDPAAKSVGAVLVVQIDPERAKQMREMQANFGKTWLMGKVISVHDVKITLQSPVDSTPHTFVADENTSFRKLREMVTLADVQVGDNLRIEGAIKDGVFLASTVSVMGPPAGGGPAQRQGAPPQ
jgi:preprotein translocase subunit YajC